MSLAEKLGYDKTDRLLIINADDYGLCHSVNYAVQHLLEKGVISSATIMMPCGWAPEAARWSAAHKEYDTGIHLTLTSEWDNYKWGPVSSALQLTDSLTTADGYFPKTCEVIEQQAQEKQVRGEIIAQIEKALHMGIEPTHADNHMGSLYGLQTGRHFLPLVLDICATYGLPFRLPRYLLAGENQPAPPEMAEQARQLAALADSKGVVILDYLLGLPFHQAQDEDYSSFKVAMANTLRGLQAGVSEIIIHPSYVTEELHAFHLQPVKRGWEKDIFLEQDIQQLLQEENIRLIRWRDLQKIQRSNHT